MCSKGASSPSVDQRPAADVEIRGHAQVHEAARVAQGPGDVALAPRVLGEDQVSRHAQRAKTVARLELEDPRGKENQLAPRSVVKILDVAFGRLAKKHRVAPEGFRHGPVRPVHRHLADLDRRVPRVPGEYPDDAHTHPPFFMWRDPTAYSRRMNGKNEIEWRKNTEGDTECSSIEPRSA